MVTVKGLFMHSTMKKRSTEKQKVHSTKNVLHLTDSYLANLMGISVKSLREQSPDALDIKRLNVQLRRALNEELVR